MLTRAFHEMTVRLKRNQDELEEKRVEIEDANHRLIAQNRELQRVNEVFEQLSITDDLTKLHNHRFFQEHLPQEMKRAERTGEPLSLILIDIDDFKQLNDRYGHSVGDAVLRRVADVMSAEVREMDLLARYGGEEFALLASQTTTRRRGSARGEAARGGIRGAIRAWWRSTDPPRFASRCPPASRPTGETRRPSSTKPTGRSTAPRTPARTASSCRTKRTSSSRSSEP